MESLRIAGLRGAETALLDLRELNLPMYVPDLPLAGYPAAEQDSIRGYLHAVRCAHALIWASPTYHGTLSGVFKNALDMLELLCDDHPPYLSARAVGLIAVSDPKTFSAMSNAAHELRAWLAPTHVALGEADFNPDFTLRLGRPTLRVERMVSELLEFAIWVHNRQLHTSAAP
jgi:FMN reductase